MASRRKGKTRFEPEDEGPWTPRTELGRKVQRGEVTSIDDIIEAGMPILEHQIVDKLIPNLTIETLDIKNTQRMTGNGRKMQFRAVALVGDGQGHLGIGVGKADETRPAISSAIKNAKRHVIRIPLGNGSWEAGKRTRNSIPIQAIGKNGSVEVRIKPAPIGVGIVANATVKKVLHAAGVKDAWSFSRGRTRGIYNTAMAVLHALDSLNKMKYYDDWERELREQEPQPAAEAPVPAADAKTEAKADEKKAE
jgi:small subunit ribosomal protein S5